MSCDSKSDKSQIYSQEGPQPLHRHGVKLAAERYDPEDGLIPDSPQLVAQILTLKPSSSPEYISSTESSDSDHIPPGVKPKRRVKAQASRGDAVLIGFMGGLNHPDLANRAGEEVLPQSDTESGSEAMASRCSHKHVDSPPNDVSSREPSASAKASHENGNEKQILAVYARPELPRLFTESGITQENKDRGYLGKCSQADIDCVPNHYLRNQTPSVEISNNNPGLGINGIATPGPPRISKASGPVSSPTSPMIRRATLSSATTANDTALPAMQPSQQLNVPKSPSQQQGLPSLHDSGLKPLLDGAPLRNGLRPQPTPASANAVLSPPMSSKMSTFPSPPSRSSSNFSPQYANGHPSPAYSNPSPRDPRNMSSPSHHGVHFSHFVSRSGNDALTPQSADSYVSSSAAGRSPKANIDTIEVDRSGRLLPPLVPHPGPPVINGSFQCTFDGCSAAPFPTQYLLK